MFFLHNLAIILLSDIYLIKNLFQCCRLPFCPTKGVLHLKLFSFVRSSLLVFVLSVCTNVFCSGHIVSCANVFRFIPHFLYKVLTLMIFLCSEQIFLSFPLLFCAVMTFIELSCLVAMKVVSGPQCGIMHIHEHGHLTVLEDNMQYSLQYYKSLRCNFQHKHLYHNIVCKFLLVLCCTVNVLSLI